MPRIRTSRLELREFLIEDLDDYASFMADEETARFVGGVLSREYAFRHMAMLLGHWQLRGFGMWAVVEQASDQFVGRVGLHFPEGWPGIEVGWLIGRSYWGQGFATEAAQASLRFAFQQLALPQVISLIDANNGRSLAVAKRLGMSYLRDDKLRGKTVQVHGIDHSQWNRSDSTDC